MLYNGVHQFTADRLKQADQMFTDWFYGPYDEQKLIQFESLYHIPLVKDYMDYKLDLRADKEYMERYGMEYADIHDPRKLSQVQSGSRLIGSTLNFVSKNLEKLYR